MEILLLVILLLVFLLPSFLMMRKQKRNQAEIQTFQNSLRPGDKVVTVSGLHGTVTAIAETSVILEVAPGIDITMEKMSVVRYQHTGMVGTADSAGAVGYTHPEDTPEAPLDDQRGQSPSEPPFQAGGDTGSVDNAPEDPDNRDTDGDHPENRP